MDRSMRPEAKIFAHWGEEQQLHTLLEMISTHQEMDETM